ncbi:MAG: fimbrillin family protein [Mediterranea sp.]|nr:fimbrillin family protein [Mediterranea sp.]
MKKIAVNILMATALIGMGSCTNEDSIKGDTLTPDENGMVTLYVSTKGSGWNNTPDTRGTAQVPTRITQDLGNGYTLETELTEVPATRASSQTLGSGVEILMLAFETSNPDKVVGHEFLKVSGEQAGEEEGNLAIQLPANSTYNLVFYSYNTKYDTSADLPWDLSELFEEGPSFATGEAPKHGNFNGVNPSSTLDASDIPVGYKYYAPEGQANGTTGYIPISNQKNPADAMYAVANNVSTSKPFTGTIKFRHLFSKLKWKLQVDGNEETVGALDASFYPRHEAGTLLMSKLKDPSSNSTTSNIWKGGGSKESEAGLFSVIGTNGNKYSTIEFPSFLFMPAQGEKTYIHLNSITFAKKTGVNITVEDASIPISTSSSTAGQLEPGKEYSVTSKVTKKDDGNLSVDNNVVINDYNKEEGSDSDYQEVE